jgi:hypothetical protein
MGTRATDVRINSLQLAPNLNSIHLKEPQMSESTKSRPASKNAIPPPGIRCTFTDLAGRQCRNLALRPTGKGASRKKSGLCLAHATEERQLRDAEAVAEELLGNTGTLDSTVAVNNVLRKIFELTVEDRIPMRKAALLTYQASLLLHSITGVKSEVHTLCKPEAWTYMIKRSYEAMAGNSGSDDDSEPDSDSKSEIESDSNTAMDPNPVQATGSEPASQTQ